MKTNEQWNEECGYEPIMRPILWTPLYEVDCKCWGFYYFMRYIFIYFILGLLIGYFCEDQYPKFLESGWVVALKTLLTLPLTLMGHGNKRFKNKT